MEFYVPEQFIEATDAVRDEIQGGQKKLIGTAAMAMFLGMPPKVRDAIYEWAYLNARRPRECDPNEAAVIAMRLLRQMEPPEAARAHSEERGEAFVGTLYHYNEPPIQRDGFVEQIIRTFEVKHEFDPTTGQIIEPDHPYPKKEEGGGGLRRKETG